MSDKIPCRNCLILPICLNKHFSYDGYGHSVALLASQCVLLKSYIFDYIKFPEIIEKRIEIVKYFESVRYEKVSM